LEASDKRVCDEIPDLLPKFRKMIEIVKPDRVCCGAFEQGHLDHDATNYLVNKAFEGPIYEIPFYHTYKTYPPRLNRFSDEGGESDEDAENVRKLNANEQRFKKRVARMYKSQRIWMNLLLYEGLQLALLKPDALAKTERMREQKHTDFRKPNHPLPLARRVERSKKWRRWLRALSAFESTDTVR